MLTSSESFATHHFHYTLMRLNGWMLLNVIEALMYIEKDEITPSHETSYGRVILTREDYPRE